MTEKRRATAALAAAFAALERDPVAERLSALQRSDALDRQLAELKSKLQAGGGILPRPDQQPN